MIGENGVLETGSDIFGFRSLDTYRDSNDSGPHAEYLFIDDLGSIFLLPLPTATVILKANTSSSDYRTWDSCGASTIVCKHSGLSLRTASLVLKKTHLTSSRRVCLNASFS